MEKKTFFKSLLPFLPLLVIYIVVVFVFSSNELVDDEGRYMVYATNLTNGYYADAGNPEIGNGPGYPLAISLFVLCNAPYIVIKLLNVIFLIAAVVYFFKTLSIVISPIQSIAFSYLLGLYPSFLKGIIYIHSEALAIFLACGFLYHFIKLNRQPSKRRLNLVLSAAFLGMLALTKVIFGYVIVSCAIFCLILYLFKKSKKLKHSLLVLAGGFMLCIPFLIHTHALTGKIFYWGTQGGELLYWRTSPFPNEYGDWINKEMLLGNYEDQDYFDVSELTKNHGAFVQSLEPYPPVQRDSIYKAKAIENIKQYPIEYIKNTGASAFRLFFNYPYSYTPQKITTAFYIIPNIFLVVFLILSCYLAIRYLAAIPFEIRFIGLLALIFMGGLTLLDGRVSHLLPIIPLLLFFIVFIFRQLVEFKIIQKDSKIL